MDIAVYVAIAMIIGAGGGYSLAAMGLRFRLPIFWNPDNND
jgi:hypothetical protein